MRSDELQPGDRVWVRLSPDVPAVQGTVEHGGAYWDGVVSWPASLILHDDGREDVYLEHMIIGRVEPAAVSRPAGSRSPAAR